MELTTEQIRGDTQRAALQTALYFYSRTNYTISNG